MEENSKNKSSIGVASLVLGIISMISSILLFSNAFINSLVFKCTHQFNFITPTF